MASQGPLNPGTVADDASHGPGSNVWSNPSNAAASDNAYAIYTLSAGNRPSHYLKATNFGFSIPSGATIDGIIVEIEKSTGGSGTVTDDEVKIVKADGSIGTTNKALAGDWPAEQYHTYGGATDKWGETWTDANINDVDFGVVISANRVTGTTPSARVDHIRITVHYTESGGGTTHNAAATIAGSTVVAAAAAAVFGAAAAIQGSTVVAASSVLHMGAGATIAGLGGVTAAASMVFGAAATISGSTALAASATLEGDPGPGGSSVGELHIGRGRRKRIDVS